MSDINNTTTEISNIPTTTISVPDRSPQGNPITTSIFGRTTVRNSDINNNLNVQNNAQIRKTNLVYAPPNKNTNEAYIKTLIKDLKKEYYTYALPIGENLPFYDREFFILGRCSSISPYLSTTDSYHVTNIPKFSYSPSWYPNVIGTHLAGNFLRVLTDFPTIVMGRHSDPEERPLHSYFAQIYNAWRVDQNTQNMFNYNRWNNNEIRASNMIDFIRNGISEHIGLDGSLTMLGYLVLSNALKYLQPYDTDVSWMFGGLSIANGFDYTPRSFLIRDINDEIEYFPFHETYRAVIAHNDGHEPPIPTFYAIGFQEYLGLSKNGRDIQPGHTDHHIFVVAMNDLTDLEYAILIAIQITSTPIMFMKMTDFELSGGGWAHQTMEGLPGLAVPGLRNIWDSSIINNNWYDPTHIIDNDHSYKIYVIHGDAYTNNEVYVPLAGTANNTWGGVTLQAYLNDVFSQDLHVYAETCMSLWSKLRDQFTDRELTQITDMCADLRTRYWQTNAYTDYKPRTPEDIGARVRITTASNLKNHYFTVSSPGTSDEYSQEATPLIAENSRFRATTPSCLQCVNPQLIANLNPSDHSGTVPQFSITLWCMQNLRWCYNPDLATRPEKCISDPTIRMLYSKHEIIVPWIIQKSSLLCIGTDFINNMLNIPWECFPYSRLTNLGTILGPEWNFSQYALRLEQVKPMWEMMTTPEGSNLTTIIHFVKRGGTTTESFTHNEIFVTIKHFKYSSNGRDHTLKSSTVVKLLNDYKELAKNRADRSNAIGVSDLKTNKFRVDGINPTMIRIAEYEVGLSTHQKDKLKLAQLLYDTMNTDVILHDKTIFDDGWIPVEKTNDLYWDKLSLPIYCVEELNRYQSVLQNNMIGPIAQETLGSFFKCPVVYYDVIANYVVNENLYHRASVALVPMPFIPVYFTNHFSTSTDMEVRVYDLSLKHPTRDKEPMCFSLVDAKSDLSVDFDTLRVGDNSLLFSF